MPREYLLIIQSSEEFGSRQFGIRLDSDSNQSTEEYSYLKPPGDQQNCFEIPGVRDVQGETTVIHGHKATPRNAASRSR